ncbi:MAG TPA: TraR/DksA family transcriptional regulator [Edaphobacter sp.]|nr:TraR/DksA family transcriptional regulator [Edaphobacter sp.]
MEQGPNTRLELNKFEAILSSRAAELAHEPRRRDLITVERTADQLDEVQQASDRALAVSYFDRESHQLREARGALSRIQEGTFGICTERGEDIQFKRLRAVPWTAFCIDCQEEQDRDRKYMSGAGPDEEDFSWGNRAA